MTRWIPKVNQRIKCHGHEGVIIGVQPRITGGNDDDPDYFLTIISDGWLFETYAFECRLLNSS